MGIRIHKVLGYGIKDFKGFDKDPRINPEFAPIYDYLDEYKTWAGFLSYAKTWRKKSDPKDMWDENKELEILLHTYKPPHGFSTFFNVGGYASEGRKYPLILRNLLHEDHYRYDDIIDYYEQNSTPIDKFKWLQKSIYPDDGFVWKKDGRRVVTKHYDNMCFHSVMRNEKNKYTSANNVIIKNMVGLTADEFREQATYTINLFVVAVCEYLKVFKNPYELYNFKPCIYTYWG